MALRVNYIKVSKNLTKGATVMKKEKIKLQQKVKINSNQKEQILS